MKPPCCPCIICIMRLGPQSPGPPAMAGMAIAPITAAVKAAPSVRIVLRFISLPHRVRVSMRPRCRVSVAGVCQAGGRLVSLCRRARICDRVIHTFFRPNAKPGYERDMTDHMPHILVVDDHREIRDAVTRYLEKNGLRAKSAKSAAEMDVALQGGRFDLVILDVMMPGEDGLSAARRLATAGGPPVLMLSALGDETDRIVGLEVGADDYLPKPFNPRELLARVKAILRRSERPEPLAGHIGGRRLVFAGWVLDTDTRALTHEDGREVSLTTAEFKLLTAFLERPRFVLSRDQLLDITSGRTADVFDRTIDNQVSRLRRKIEDDPAHPRIIATIRAGGYSLAADVREVL